MESQRETNVTNMTNMTNMRMCTRVRNEVSLSFFLSFARVRLSSIFSPRSYSFFLSFFLSFFPSFFLLWQWERLPPAAGVRAKRVSRDTRAPARAPIRRGRTEEEQKRRSALYEGEFFLSLFFFFFFFFSTLWVIERVRVSLRTRVRESIFC